MEERIIETTETPYGRIHMLEPVRVGTEDDMNDLCELLARILIKRHIRQQTKTTDS